MKTQKEIDEINEQRAEAMHHLANAFETFKATGCSLGADHISECIKKLHEDNCVEY